MSDQSPNNLIYDLPLSASIEGLLFVAAGPVSIAQLAHVLGRTIMEIEEGLQVLQVRYDNNFGLRLQRFSDRILLTTSPVLAPVIEKFLGLESTGRLSKAGLEALAIIAYRQPITRPGIDSIRGVNSDGVLRSLLTKGLIQEMGRVEGPGRPILYGITSDFMQYFGLSSLNELPPYEIKELKPVEDIRLLKD